MSLHNYFMSELNSTDRLNSNDNSNLEKKEANINSIMGYDITRIRKLLYPQAQLKKTYICLDRMIRSYESDDRTSTTWEFQNNASAIDSNISVPGRLGEIVGIKIYDYFITLTNSKWVPDQMIQTVSIKEFENQGFIGPENRRFHFLGYMTQDTQVTNTTSWYVAFTRGAQAGVMEGFGRRQDGNQGEFWFREPIKRLDSITLTFGAPWQLIPMEKDTFELVSFNSGTALVTVDGSEPISQSSAMRLYIYELLTDNPVADANMLKLLNRSQGWLADNTTVSNEFTIYEFGDSLTPMPALSALVGNIISGKVYIEVSRFLICLEVTYIEPYLGVINT